MFMSALQAGERRRLDLGNLEGLAGDLAEALGRHQVLAAQQGDELAAVHLRHQDAIETVEQGAEVARQRPRSEEHTSELQSLMRISYAVFCLKKKNTQQTHKQTTT